MIFIQTFSGFDVFINDQIIYFPSKKSKELLAILVDKRGGSVSISQLAYMLYENISEETAKKNIRVIAHRLRKTLEERGCEKLLIHKRGIYSINTGLFTCDLYEVLSGNREHMTTYTGSYMAEYPWASETVPYLNVIYANYYENYKLSINSHPHS